LFLKKPTTSSGCNRGNKRPRGFEGLRGTLEQHSSASGHEADKPWKLDKTRPGITLFRRIPTNLNLPWNDNLPAKWLKGMILQKFCVVLLVLHAC
jgi:hypothetical protein